MRTTIVTLGVIVVLGLAAAGNAADEARSASTTLDVWPGAVPGEKEPIGEEKTKKAQGSDVIVSLTNVSKPTLSVFNPADGKNTGVAIVVFPGGGYTNLAWDHEGEQVGRWLSSIGVTGVVLKYRVPRRPGTPRGEPPIQALMDAQRSISLVRSKAADWGIDAKRIGVLGFSAGGHLAAWSATNFDKRSYETIDSVDQVSCRPDFAVMVYAGGVIKRGSTELAPEIRVSAQTPPSFVVHAANDSAENSIYLYLALRQAKVPAEMHIFGSGGHGFGMRPSAHPSSGWTKRCEEWLRDQGILKAEGGS